MHAEEPLLPPTSGGSLALAGHGDPRFVASNPCLVCGRSWQERWIEATLEELADVLARAKFDPYVTIEEHQEFLRLLGRIAEMVPIIRTIQACRDARDDKFLELAVNGEANLIITGDAELLDLDPFRGVSIIPLASYLAW